MSIFLELLQEVKDEVTQEAWDRVLLKEFREKSYPLTGLVVDKFRADYKLSREQFQELKRVPRYPRQFKTRIPRFIAAYLPALNDKLYEGKMSDDALIAWMEKVNLDTENRPADLHATSAHGRRRKQAHTLIEVNRLEIELRAEVNDAYSRKWTTVKAVRSK